MQAVSPSLRQLLEPVVSGMGYDYVGAQLGQGDAGLTLRIFIDHSNGITVDDCGDVSRQLSAMLDVAEPISGHYVLEVSSPGIERPLFELAHYQQFVGERVKLRLGAHALGRRRFTGQLQAVEGQTVVVEVDGEPYELAFADIEAGQLAPL